MTPDTDAWVRQQLTRPELTFLRHRPWADTWRVESSEGRWWLKINAADTRYEPRLLDVLARSGSALLPAVLTHPDEPRALIGDAGTSARELLADAEPEQRISFWIDVLPAYAELQRTVSVADLQVAGVPDLSPAALTDTFDTLVDDGAWFTAAVAPELDRKQWDRILASRARLAAGAARLAGGLTPTLQHDDLHDGNVFRRGSANLVIDWGDAVLAHPFGALLVTLDVLAHQLDCARTDPRIGRVQDAYLEVWRIRGDSRAELSEELDLAVRTAGLGRAAGWRRALGTPTAGLELGDADAVAHWLGRLADALADALHYAEQGERQGDRGAAAATRQHRQHGRRPGASVGRAVQGHPAGRRAQGRARPAAGRSGA